MSDDFIVINVCSVRLRRSALVLTLDRLEFQLRTFGRLPPHFSYFGYRVLINRNPLIWVSDLEVTVSFDI